MYQKNFNEWFKIKESKYMRGEYQVMFCPPFLNKEFLYIVCVDYKQAQKIIDDRVLEIEGYFDKSSSL